MKTSTGSKFSRRAAGFSLLEISLVMALIVSLCVGMGIGVTSMQKWKKGKNAALSLQAVYSAQRAYMADHPTADISDVTSAQLITYLPQGWSELPVVAGLSNESLTLDFHVMPPVLKSGATNYDPSGSSSDGLWDTSE